MSDQYERRGLLWVPAEPPRRPRGLDLFAGAGGFSLGMAQGGIDVVAAAEWWTDAAVTYVLNLAADGCQIVSDSEAEAAEIARHIGGNREGDWPRDCRWLWNRDVCELTGADVVAAVGPIDVVFGGPPCQGMSRSNKKASINDPRNALVGEFMRIVGELRPKGFVMENVPQLFTIGEGSLYESLEETAIGIGYTVTSQVLDAASYGVPQRRRRAIVFGALDGLPTLPMPTHWARVRRPGSAAPQRLVEVESEEQQQDLFGGAP